MVLTVKKMETTEINELGSIHISQKALAAAAAQTALSVEGVNSLGASIAEAAARRIGRAALSQGVDAAIDGTDVELTVRLVVQYGCRIPDVAMEVQKRIKDAVESSAGCRVTAVHVVIQDIAFSSVGDEERKGGWENE